MLTEAIYYVGPISFLIRDWERKVRGRKRQRETLEDVIPVRIRLISFFYCFPASSRRHTDRHRSLFCECGKPSFLEFLFGPFFIVPYGPGGDAHKITRWKKPFFLVHEEVAAMLDFFGCQKRLRHWTTEHSLGVSPEIFGKLKTIGNVDWMGRAQTIDVILHKTGLQPWNTVLNRQRYTGISHWKSQFGSVRFVVKSHDSFFTNSWIRERLVQYSCLRSTCRTEIHSPGLMHLCDHLEHLLAGRWSWRTIPGWHRCFFWHIVSPEILYHQQSGFEKGPTIVWF